MTVELVPKGIYLSPGHWNQVTAELSLGDLFGRSFNELDIFVRVRFYKVCLITLAVEGIIPGEICWQTLKTSESGNLYGFPEIKKPGIYQVRCATIAGRLRLRAWRWYGRIRAEAWLEEVDG